MTDAATETSVPAMLLARAAATPGTVALREKRRGCWQATTWQGYADRVAVTAAGLAAIGVGSGDRVVLLADNRSEWLVTDIAIQVLGASSVAVASVAEPAELAKEVVAAKATVVVAEDEEQVDKIMAVRRKLTKVKKVVVIDPRGIEMSDLLLMTLVELEALGSASPVDVAALAAGIDLDTPATEALTHRDLVAAADRAAAEGGVDPRAEVLSFLPLGRLDERVVSEVNAVRHGYVVNFGDGGDALADDLREVQPTCVLGVPEVWESLMAGVTTRMAGAGRLHRASYRVWLGVGMGVGRRRRSGERLSVVDRVRDGMAWLLLQRPLRAKLGLARARRVLIGDGPLDPQVVDFFWAIGVPLAEGNGLGAEG